jgi:glycosyltransferase involved in cell wall biosynthesis
MCESKVMVISERYWPEGGGGELATHSIINILRKLCNVSVVTGSQNIARLPGVKYIYEPLLIKWKRPIIWFNTLMLTRKRDFEKLLSDNSIVYIPKAAYPIIPYAKKMGKTVIVHLHGYMPISYTTNVLAPYEEHRYRIRQDDIMLSCMRGIKSCIGANLLWWIPRVARKWIAQADKVICVSRRHAEIISDSAPELRDKIEIAPNPLPLELINLMNKEFSKNLNEIPTFLYVGGDSYVKGFPLLLQILRELGKRGDKIRFILTNSYGPRSLRTLKALNEKYRNLEIRVVGRVTYEEILSLYKQAWALIFPSLWEETFGYAVVEASLLSTIPVSSRVGGIIEILNDTSASRFMFSLNNTAEAFEKCRTISSLSPREILALGRKLRGEMLKKFEPDVIEKKIINIFK